MLIIEHGHGRPASLDDGHDVVEEPLAGILALALGVDRILAVLADRQHGVDGQPVAPEAERLGDGRIDRDRVLFGYVAGHVVGVGLVEVERCDLEAWLGPAAVEQVGLEEVLEDDVGVVAVAQLGDDRRDLRPLARREGRPPPVEGRGERGPDDPQPRTPEELPTVKLASLPARSSMALASPPSHQFISHRVTLESDWCLTRMEPGLIPRIRVPSPRPSPGGEREREIRPPLPPGEGRGEGATGRLRLRGDEGTAFPSCWDTTEIRSQHLLNGLTDAEQAGKHADGRSVGQGGMADRPREA